MEIFSRLRASIALIETANTTREKSLKHREEYRGHYIEEQHDPHRFEVYFAATDPREDALYDAPTLEELHKVIDEICDERAREMN